MNLKKINICCGVACFLQICVLAQDTNLARLEYAYIPQRKSDNSYSRFRFSGNYPIKLKQEGSYLVLGMEYRRNELQLEDALFLDSTSNLETFHTIGAEFGYTFKLKNNWRFGAKLGLRISSNFEGLGILSDDFRYTGSVFFVKSYKNKNAPKSSRLILGLRYTVPASINFPLPIINYTNRFHPSWSYSLGTPKTSLKYYFSEKQTLQLFIGLDRFYGNIQNKRRFIGDNGENDLAENISMLLINNAVGYEFFFTEHLLLFAYGGYTISNEIRFRNRKQNNVLIINDQNTLYLRTGIKLKI